MKRQNLRTVSLIVVTFTYLLIGAAIFGYLESEHEIRQREALELIERIVKRKYNISEDDFTVLTTTVIKSVPHKAGIQWRFPGAFYFATTVVTTIGYGHSTPATMAGRSFCMIYALIGIPLGLVMFQSIGERLNTFVGSALKWAKRCFKARNQEVTQTNLVMVVSVLSTILMTSMAAVFAKYERWDYFDALYYCFITLTTIGFGDYVALQKESALQSKPEYVALSLIFILFGLSVVSSAVNLLVLKFLTLNTEDERRDERLKFTANLNSIQLEGDVITPSAAAIRQRQELELEFEEDQKLKHKLNKEHGEQNPADSSSGPDDSLTVYAERVSQHKHHGHKHHRRPHQHRRGGRPVAETCACQLRDNKKRLLAAWPQGAHYQHDQLLAWRPDPWRQPDENVDLNYQRSAAAAATAAAAAVQGDDAGDDDDAEHTATCSCSSSEVPSHVRSACCLPTNSSDDRSLASGRALVVRTPLARAPIELAPVDSQPPVGVLSRPPKARLQVCKTTSGPEWSLGGEHEQADSYGKRAASARWRTNHTTERRHQPTGRLVCRCCCNHADCLAQALHSISAGQLAAGSQKLRHRKRPTIGYQPADLTSATTPATTGDDSCRQDAADQEPSSLASSNGPLS